MTDRRAWVLLAGVLALLLALALLSAPPTTTLDRRLSTLRSTPDGARALYLALPALGIPVARRHTPLADADSIAGPLALLAPEPPASPREAHALAAWVRRGGTLVYAAAPGDPMLDSLSLPGTTREAAPRSDSAPKPTEEVRTSIGAPPARARVFNVRPGRSYAPYTVLLRSQRGTPTVIDARVGGGQVLAISDASTLSNEDVRTGGVAWLVAGIAARTAGAGHPLVFDEYHHGMAGGSAASGLIRLARRHRVLGALLQLLAVALVALAARARRLGSPAPQAAASRRSPLEHVDALAAAYRGAGARVTPLLLLVGGMARRLGRPRPRTVAEAEALLDAVARARPAVGSVTRRLAGSLAPSGRGLAGVAEDVDRILGEFKR